MVRLNNNEIVGWWCFEQSVEDIILEDHTNEAVSTSNMFRSIIGKDFSTEDHDDDEAFLIVHMKRRSIRRGVWVVTDWERVLRHHGVDLPYEGPYAWIVGESDSERESESEIEGESDGESDGGIGDEIQGDVAQAA
jgi:hypothetical protein